MQGVPGYDVDYQRRYLINRREKAKAHLGGKCVTCGSTDDLHFDHRDPATKTIEISNAIAAHWSWGRLLPELAKCQLLCAEHHRLKTKTDGSSRGGGHNKIHNPAHGTWARYRNHRCRCEACRTWRRQYDAKLVDARGVPKDR